MRRLVEGGGREGSPGVRGLQACAAGALQAGRKEEEERENVVLRRPQGPGRRLPQTGNATRPSPGRVGRELGAPARIPALTGRVPSRQTWDEASHAACGRCGVRAGGDPREARGRGDPPAAPRSPGSARFVVPAARTTKTLAALPAPVPASVPSARFPPSLP